MARRESGDPVEPCHRRPRTCRTLPGLLKRYLSSAFTPYRHPPHGPTEARGRGGSREVVSEGAPPVRRFQRACPAEGILDIHAVQRDRLNRPGRSGSLTRPEGQRVRPAQRALWAGWKPKGRRHPYGPAAAGLLGAAEQDAQSGPGLPAVRAADPETCSSADRASPLETTWWLAVAG